MSGASPGALVTLVAVALYFLLCIAVGWWALRRTRSTADFFVAGRNLGVFVAAFAVFSSTMSGFGFVGGPGLMYSMGSSSIWILVPAVLAPVLALALIAKPIRLVSELRDCISLPDIAEARYDSREVRAAVAVVILLGVLGYLATQILAMAIVLQGVLTEARVFPGIGLGWCVAIATSVLVFYSVTGGIVASVYTDLVQGAIMVVAAVLVFITILGTFDGGLTEVHRIIAADDPAAAGPWGTLGMAGALSWFFLFGLGMVGQPHIITKYMMLRRVRDARFVVPLGVFAFLLTALLWIGVGVAMRALVLSGNAPALANPDAASPVFLQGFTHPVLAGVVFAALLAAIMSTADAFLNVGTAAIMHDIPRAILGRSIRHELAWARVTTALVAVVAAVFAVASGDLVALLGAFGYGTFAAGLAPVLALGLNWKRATPRAAIVAIASSILVNFGLRLGGVTLPYGIDHGAAAFAVSLALFIGISLLEPRRPLPADLEAVMDL